MTIIDIIIYGSICSVFPIAVLGVVINRCITKKAFGVRVVQFLGIIFLIPVIAILALEDVLTGEPVAALLGGLIGYLFGNISNFDLKEDKKS